MSELLAELERAADTFRFDVPPSHRGLVGAGISAAKRLFVRGLEPMHIELLRPQRELNLAVQRLLARIVAGELPGRGAEQVVRDTLAPLAEPVQREVQSHRAGRVGAAISATKRSYLEAVTPAVAELLETQRRFNAHASTCLVQLALGRLRRESGGLTQLAALADPFSEGNRVALAPLWREVFRAQVAFNQQLAHTLATLAPVRGDSALFFPTLTVVARGSDPAFLRSIAAQCYPAAFEVLLVGATDPGRFGWARAVTDFHHALRSARGDVVFFTDARRLLSSSFFEAHAHAYLDDERVGATSCPPAALPIGDPWDALARLERTGGGEPKRFASVKRSLIPPGVSDEDELARRVHQSGARSVHVASAVSVSLETGR